MAFQVKKGNQGLSVRRDLGALTAGHSGGRELLTSTEFFANLSRY